jgi:hypothetical protein
MEDSNTANLCYHVVFYCDVLGQRATLSKLTELPGTEQEKAETIKLLQQSAGVILGLRDFFADYFQALTKESALAASLPENQRAEIRRTRPAKPSFRFFSDSFVVWIPTYDEDATLEGCRAIGAVFLTLLAAGATQVVALGTHTPMRGGVDVGLGIELRGFEDLYGPALVRAVHLEDAVAGYPRIAVGDELLKFVDAFSRCSVRTPYGQLNRILAQASARLLFTDADGRRALDFLGQEVRNSDLGGHLAKLVPSAFRFVAGERSKWHAAGNAKLSSRYDSLWSYLCSRAAVWGLDPGGI